jgi:hypothetical protein
VWDASRGHATTLTDLDGRTGCIGLDLSAISDLTSMALVMPCRGTTDAWDVFLKCYLPEDALPGHRHKALYRQRERDGVPDADTWQRRELPRRRFATCEARHTSIRSRREHRLALPGHREGHTVKRTRTEPAANEPDARKLRRADEGLGAPRESRDAPPRWTPCFAWRSITSWTVTVTRSRVRRAHTRCGPLTPEVSGSGLSRLEP